MGVEHSHSRNALRAQATPLSRHENIPVPIKHLRISHHLYLYNSEFEVARLLNTDENTIDRWLTLMEANYWDKNPYHNSTHAADVLAVCTF